MVLEGMDRVRESNPCWGKATVPTFWRVAQPAIYCLWFTRGSNGGEFVTREEVWVCGLFGLGLGFGAVSDRVRRELERRRRERGG